MKDYKYVPSDTQTAKLRYRCALFYRLQGNPDDALWALETIEDALELQPGDAAITRERETILVWVKSLELERWYEPLT